jgi:hypothetical protein
MFECFQVHGFRKLWSDTFVITETRMKKPAKVLLLALSLMGFHASPMQAETSERLSSPDAGFEAVITGSYEGEVSGTGVLMLLPEAGFGKEGYFFLADGQGVRPHGVTFVLPRSLTPGKYTLESPSPFDIGTVLSVRVDKDMGDLVLSSEKNTSGSLDLIAFPADENSLSGSDVIGTFEFKTEDSKGQRIAVKGTFSFKVP